MAHSPPTPASPVAEIVLDYLPRTWQAKEHIAKERFTVLALHRRAGKTEWGVMEAIDSAMTTSLPDALFVYLAPFLKQAKAIAWSRIKHYARQLPGTEVNESELWVRFRHNGARVQINGGDNPDGLRGLRLDGVILDEVAQMRPEVWNEIVQPALSDRMGWACFIGTPHGVNLFSDLFYRAVTLPEWRSALYTVFDTDSLDPGEVSRLQRDMPSNEFAREYLCDFSAAAEDQLISISMAEEAAQRTARESDVVRSARILGVDVARFGDDKSVIIRRQGIIAYPPLVFSGLDNMAFAARVAQEITAWSPDAVFVDVGNGSGVIDRLRQLGHAVVEVNFGGKAGQAEYVNKRTEMFWNLKEWLENGGIIPNDHGLKQDLACPTYSYNSRNQVCLESKDEIKKRILRSPDIADALALTFAYPVGPRVDELGRMQRAKQRSYQDWDPLASA